MSRPKLTLSNETKGQEHRESKLYAYENVWFSKKTKSVKSGTGLSLFRGVIPNVSVAVAYTEGGVCARAVCGEGPQIGRSTIATVLFSLARSSLSLVSLSLSLSLLFNLFPSVFPLFQIAFSNEKRAFDFSIKKFDRRQTIYSWRGFPFQTKFWFQHATELRDKMQFLLSHPQRWRFPRILDEKVNRENAAFGGV